MQGPKQCFSGYPNRRSYTVAKYKNIGEGVYLTPDIEKAEVYTDKIKVHDILYLSGRVEKRYDKYQFVVNNIKEIIE